jgi:hypothetical protein
LVTLVMMIEKTNKRARVMLMMLSLKKRAT